MRYIFSFFCSVVLFFSGFVGIAEAHTSQDSLATSFDQASNELHVPVELLKTICYMEGRLSNHNGYPSVDEGYGCMHLVKNDRVDTLDKAASLLHVDTDQLKNDMATNIRGGAALLREDALQLSDDHTLPTALADWYGAVAAYSNATTKQSAQMYADAVFAIIKNGFNAPADTGETVQLPPEKVVPNTNTANNVTPTPSLPAGCVTDGDTEYPGAINCPLDPNKFNCNVVASTDPCTYEDANRPTDLPILFVGIHDVEGSVQDALKVFQDPTSSVSIHYIVDTDGTVYQMVREKDIAYHIGNFWYNQRSIGIEHAGFDATGFQWYNAGEYLGSAKLTAYLLKKYNIPLDHDHIVSHGTVPAPTLGTSPNHVDPGPYWLWDYYLKLIHKQGVPYADGEYSDKIISLHPQTDQRPFNPNGTETPANFNFFYLYNGPSTKSGLIPSAASGTDIIDETNNVEQAISYPYLAKVKDFAGSGNTMYKIWYGENDNISSASATSAGASNADNDRVKAGPDIINNGINIENDRPKGGASNGMQAQTSSSNWFANAKPVWLAVPEDAVEEGKGRLVKLTATNSATLKIYGRPVSNDAYVIGDAPNNALFASAFTIAESATNILWYEINYNHRQAWVPTSEIRVDK